MMAKNEQKHVLFLNRNDEQSIFILHYLWHKILRDGLVTVIFYDGSVRDINDFVTCMTSIGTLPFIILNEDKDISLFAWVNCLEGAIGRLHFTMFKESWGTKRNAFELGRYMIEYILSQKDSEGYIIQTLVGLTPLTNKLAVRYALKTGMSYMGILPNAVKLYYENGRIDDAMMTIATRQTMGLEAK